MFLIIILQRLCWSWRGHTNSKISLQHSSDPWSSELITFMNYKQLDVSATPPSSLSSLTFHYDLIVLSVDVDINQFRHQLNNFLCQPATYNF